MAVTVKHAYQTATADDPTDEVSATRWNEAHTLTGLGTAAEADSADFATAAQGVLADTALQAADVGTAAYAATGDFATAAQGALADSAVQAADLATVATTGDYNDLINTPASSSPPFDDATAIVKGSADATKLLRFEVDGFTTATTRVLTPPNANGTIAVLSLAQTWTAQQTLSGVNLVVGTNQRIEINDGVNGVRVGNIGGLYGCEFNSGGTLRWTSGATGGTADTGFKRNAAGVLEVNNGTAGTLRDLRCRMTRTDAVTVASLVAAATAGAGARGFVTDANSATFGAAAVGGGANAMPVWCDGAGWFIG
jgi:hypothetical protein